MLQAPIAKIGELNKMAGRQSDILVSQTPVLFMLIQRAMRRILLTLKQRIVSIFKFTVAPAHLLPQGFASGARESAAGSDARPSY